MSRDLNQKKFRMGWRLGLIFLAALLLWAGLVVVLVPLNQLRLAQFRLDVLALLIRAHYLVQERQIESFQDLPDFHIVSYFDSLSFRKSDLREGIADGYIYDMNYLGQGKYVISASPVGVLAPKVELGITHQGYLMLNNKNIDSSADSFEEVTGWEPTIRYDRPMTYSKL
jgi:hypothetical protein